jgi:RNA polymerase sigma factor (sigma-70 family)
MRANEEEWAVLMRAAISGDSGAYRRFLEQISPVIRAVARRNLSRRGIVSNDAEDVVQETLLAIHLKRETWDSGRPIGPWIAAIARNKLVDALRRRGYSRAEVAIDDVIDSLGGKDAGDTPGKDELERMLRKLNERQRSIVRSLSLDGVSVRETARRFNMSEGAVRVTLHRALKALAALYRGDDR